jgi:putative ABC transport system substrate-binding protein
MVVRFTRLATALALLLLAAPPAAEAQQPKTVVRLGFLGSSTFERQRNLVAALQRALRDLGHVEGQNIVLEQRYAGGQFQKLPELAAELVRLKVDVLIVEGAPAAHAAKNATRAIPIVFTNAADPVGTGLVASLARPGGNITGLSDFNAGVVAKRLELLKEVVPAASRIAVLLNPANPTNPLQLKLTRAAASSLGVTLLAFEARRADDIDRAFVAIRTERPEALIVIGDPMLGSHRRRIVDLSAKSRLPAIYSTRPSVDDGGLMSYGTNFEHLYRRAATYVDKILKGANPGDLPIEQPTKFELVINLKTTKTLRLPIPQSLLLRADQVIDQ